MCSTNCQASSPRKIFPAKLETQNKIGLFLIRIDHLVIYEHGRGDEYYRGRGGVIRQTDSALGIRRTAKVKPFFCIEFATKRGYRIFSTMRK